MIKEFVQKFYDNKQNIENELCVKHPEDYIDIVRLVVNALSVGCDYGAPDIERIHEINDGDYQGTLLFIIAANGYQPNTYWAVKVDYGSCSGCDTLQGIRNYYYDDKPTQEQVKDYMTLALHIVQGLREI